MTLLTIILMDLLTGMELNLLSPSFPELQSQFSLSPFWLEALLSVNYAGYCAGLIFIGNLADYYGRKPVILIGLFVFIVASLLCFVAQSYWLLLIGRFLQGLGIAAPGILSFLIIADSYTLQKQQSIYALLNGLLNISAGISPVLGSYITLYFNWQGNILVLLILGVVAFAMTIVFIPYHKLPKCRESVDISNYSTIFKSKPLRLLVTHITLMSVPYWIFVGMSPILYMEDLGVSIEHFGYYQGALAFVYALGIILYGIVINKFKKKKMLYLAFKIYICSFIMISIVAWCDSYNPLLITCALLLLVIGQIIPGAILYPLCLSLMPSAKGRLSAVTKIIRLMLSALSLQIAGYYYAGSFQNVGIIVALFVLSGIITMFFVLKDNSLMEFSSD